MWRIWKEKEKRTKKFWHSGARIWIPDFQSFSHPGYEFSWEVRRMRSNQNKLLKKLGLVESLWQLFEIFHLQLLRQLFEEIRIFELGMSDLNKFIQTYTYINVEIHKCTISIFWLDAVLFALSYLDKDFQFVKETVWSTKRFDPVFLSLKLV